MTKRKLTGPSLRHFVKMEASHKENEQVFFKGFKEVFFLYPESPLGTLKNNPRECERSAMVLVGYHFQWLHHNIKSCPLTASNLDVVLLLLITNFCTGSEWSTEVI